jgi:hypothetical protein
VIVDYDGYGWETTTNPAKALKMGHQIITPHNVIGYSLAGQCTYKASEKTTQHWNADYEFDRPFSFPAITPIIKKEFPFVHIFAEADLDLHKVTEGANGKVVMTKIESTEDIVDLDECIYAFIPEYQNHKPLVKDTISIENNCTGKPLIGYWKDGNIPQMVYCENLPPGYCIPLKTIAALVKVNCDDCTPVHNPKKYTVALSELNGNRIFVPYNVDFKPSTRCE